MPSLIYIAIGREAPAVAGVRGGDTAHAIHRGWELEQSKQRLDRPQSIEYTLMPSAHGRSMSVRTCRITNLHEVPEMSTANVSREVIWPALARSLSSEQASAAFLRTSAIVMRYGLVIIILWFGLFKFTPTEAQAIQPLVSKSPLLSWLYAVTDVGGVSRIIGCAEIVIAFLMALRPFSWRASAAGSMGATLMFLTTLSFLVTTPGSWGRVDGFLVPVAAGGFLIKDVLLLGAALWTAGEALSASRGNRSAQSM
jgi:uncharacterized membrane protein YkgB